MKIIGDAQTLEGSGTVVSIGMFDGVHRGHRRVLQTLRTIGRRLGLPTVVVTFDPHPRAVLRPESAPAMLASLEDRIELLTLTGAADHCLVLPFDRRAREDDECGDTVRHARPRGRSVARRLLPIALRSDHNSTWARARPPRR